MPKGRTILVVDDDPDLAKLTARRLQNYWNVIVSSSVPEALGVINSGVVEVIMTDWDMPDGGGLVVMETAIIHGIPVVVYTGAAILPHHAREHAAAVVAKPGSLLDMDRALWNALKA